MKKLAIVSLIFGLLAFVGIVIISAKSEEFSEPTKTYGFIVLGYLGVMLFSWGWLKIFKKK